MARDKKRGAKTMEECICGVDCFHLMMKQTFFVFVFDYRDVLFLNFNALSCCDQDLVEVLCFLVPF